MILLFESDELRIPFKQKTLGINLVYVEHYKYI